MKEKKPNKHTYLVLTSSALMFILGVCALIHSYNKFPTTEKLPAEIWGTVGDWVMIGVTIVTAVFLYDTLRSQKEVQEQQTILTKIELNRHRKSILPRLVIDKSNIEHKYLNNREELKVKFPINFTENAPTSLKIYSAVNFSVIVYKDVIDIRYSSKDGVESSENLQMYIVEEPLDFETRIAVELTFKETQRFTNLKAFNTHIALEFSDSEQNSYFQKITINEKLATDDEIEIRTYSPELTTN